ncbi:putative cytosolic Fe-S cluster assembly factor oxy-4 [Ditylenchus destructor]|uniref:Cytosolic Fe-S cluster assembly factor oxy-4 n=1 Tax=Ditylenchus destructor TaxID=166010 RepID=A0AAD4RDN4_9BILA|nr:putative cytosolic Fe-S cluster assembly factor oxy-4 [Ditylenchus destructor]
MVLAVAFFDREDSLIYLRIKEKELHREHDIHSFMFCSFDIVGEKAKLSLSKSAQEHFLGSLLLNNSLRSYGYLTNTNVKILIVMSQGFSGVVRISNISDFIEPSQGCILPLQSKPNTEAKLVGIHNKKNRNNPSEKTNSGDQKIKVSLSDCLACSGCVTTAETMLIDSQTTEHMLIGIQKHECSVITVSPQSLCSLAAHYNISPQAMAVRLSQYFKRLGVRYVLDSSFGRHFTRRLYYEEFYKRLRESNRDKSAPMLVGACPGFVCYAEKTHGELLTPLISRVRSPQAIMGVIVKDYLRRKLNLPSEKIFHVCVMPCYDKKLEASRKDFATDTANEVDCVITASELQPLLDASEFAVEAKLESSSHGSAQCSFLNRFERGLVIGDENEETSGGYLQHILRQLQKEFQDTRIENVQISKDSEITTLSLGNSYEPVTLAKLYGFKHIQNTVQKMKRNRLHLDFVEVMACPSGCGNGGGQIRGETSEQRATIHTNVVSRYRDLREKQQNDIAKVKIFFNKIFYGTPAIPDLAYFRKTSFCCF